MATGGIVLDRGLNRIIRLDAQGQPQPNRSIDLAPLATYGPNGLAADGRGNLYMADTGRDRIVVFDAAGHMTGSFGDSGNDLGKFHQPMFVAFGPDGSMAVTDWENARVERFDAEHHPVNAGRCRRTPRASPSTTWAASSCRIRTTVWSACSVRTARCWRNSASIDSGGAPLPVDMPSQVAVSPDGSTLWILGLNGLARQDLTPFADLRPSAWTGVSRAPLGVLGAAPAAARGRPRALAAGSPRRLWRSRAQPGSRADARHPASPSQEPSKFGAPRGLVLTDLRAGAWNRALTWVCAYCHRPRRRGGLPSGRRVFDRAPGPVAASGGTVRDEPRVRDWLRRQRRGFALALGRRLASARPVAAFAPCAARGVVGSAVAALLALAPWSSGGSSASRPGCDPRRAALDRGAAGRDRHHRLVHAALSASVQLVDAACRGRCFSWPCCRAPGTTPTCRMASGSTKPRADCRRGASSRRVASPPSPTRTVVTRVSTTT